MSSKRGVRRKACEGKIKYPDSASAKKVIWYMKHKDGWLNVYKCKFCHCYHIGHAPKRKTG